MKEKIREESVRYCKYCKSPVLVMIDKTYIKPYNFPNRPWVIPQEECLCEDGGVTKTSLYRPQVDCISLFPSVEDIEKYALLEEIRWLGEW